MSVSLKKQMEYIKKSKGGGGGEGTTKDSSTRRLSKNIAATEKGNDEEKERLVVSTDETTNTSTMPKTSSNVFAPLVKALVINETESDFVNQIKQIFKVMKN